MKKTEEVKKAKAAAGAKLAELLKLDPAAQIPGALIPGAALAPGAFSPKALKVEAPRSPAPRCPLYLI